MSWVANCRGAPPPAGDQIWMDVPARRSVKSFCIDLLFATRQVFERSARSAKAVQACPGALAPAAKTHERVRRGRGLAQCARPCPCPLRKSGKASANGPRRARCGPFASLLAVTKFLSHRRPAHRRATAAQGHSMTADTPASVPAAQPAADGETLTRFRSSEEQALRRPSPRALGHQRTRVCCLAPVTMSTSLVAAAHRERRLHV